MQEATEFFPSYTGSLWEWLLGYPSFFFFFPQIMIRGLNIQLFLFLLY